MRLKGRDMVCPAMAEITVPIVIRVKSLDQTFVRFVTGCHLEGLVIGKDT